MRTSAWFDVYKLSCIGAPHVSLPPLSRVEAGICVGVKQYFKRTWALASRTNGVPVCPRHVNVDLQSLDESSSTIQNVVLDPAFTKQLQAYDYVFMPPTQRMGAWIIATVNTNKTTSTVVCVRHEDKLPDCDSPVAALPWCFHFSPGTNAGTCIEDSAA